MLLGTLAAATMGTVAQAQATGDIRPISLPAESSASLDAPQSSTARQSVDAFNNADSSEGFSAMLGSTVWHGDFGTASDTTIVALAASLRYQLGNLRVSGQLPWMRISSNGTAFTGLGGTPLIVAPGISMPRRVRRGVGDLTLGADYLLATEEQLPVNLEVSGRVKLATASRTSGLSTGETDYSLGAEISRSVGPVIPALSASYRIFGDPDGWNLTNGVEVAASVTVPFANAGTAYAAFSYSEAASLLIDDAQEIVLGLSLPVFRERVRLTAIGSAGLSSGAADVTAGASVSLRF